MLERFLENRSDFKRKHPLRHRQLSYNAAYKGFLIGEKMSTKRLFPSLRKQEALSRTPVSSPP